MDLIEVAGYDARLASILGNGKPFEDRLRDFHSLPSANTASHNRLAERYVLDVLDTGNPQAVSRLRETVFMHALGMFKDRNTEEVLDEMRQEVDANDFFEGIFSKLEHLAHIDYTEIVNPEFGGFMGRNSEVVFPSMVQRYTIEQALERKRIAAYLPVGTGKTAIAVLAGERILSKNPGGKVLVLSTKASYDEFMKGISGSDSERYLRRKPKGYFFESHSGMDEEPFDEADFAVVNFEYLLARKGYMGETCANVLRRKPWDFVAADEPQIMMSSSSKRAMNVKEIMDVAESRDRYSLILTGTPSKDNRESFKTQVSFLGAELDELTQRDLLELSDRRTITLTDGMARTIPLEPKVVEFELPDEARRIYEEIMRDKTIHGGKSHHLRKKFVVDFAAYDVHLSDMENPKLNFLVSQVTQWMERGEKFLIFFDYAKGFLRPDEGYCFGDRFVEMLGDNGECVEIYNLTNKPSTWRYQIFDKFREDPDTMGLVIPTQSCSLALNLQVAMHIVLPTPVKDPVIYQQLQGRVNRQGQGWVPDLQVFLYRGTEEEDNIRSLSERRKNAKLLRYFVLPKGIRSSTIKPNIQETKDLVKPTSNRGDNGSKSIPEISPSTVAEPVVEEPIRSAAETRTYKTNKIQELLGVPAGSVSYHIKRSGAKRVSRGEYDASAIDKYVRTAIGAGSRELEPELPKQIEVIDEPVDVVEPTKEPSTHTETQDYVKIIGDVKSYNGGSYIVEVNGDRYTFSTPDKTEEFMIRSIREGKRPKVYQGKNALSPVGWSVYW